MTTRDTADCRRRRAKRRSVGDGGVASLHATPRRTTYRIQYTVRAQRNQKRQH